MLSIDELWHHYLSSSGKYSILLVLWFNVLVFFLWQKRSTDSKHFWTKMIIYAVPLPWNAMWIQTFNFSTKFITKGGKTNALRWRSVYWCSFCSLPLLYPLVSLRKHALNCHRMKPALFSVLCEIKEKTGEFLLLWWFTPLWKLLHCVELLLLHFLWTKLLL